MHKYVLLFEKLFSNSVKKDFSLQKNFSVRFAVDLHIS